MGFMNNSTNICRFRVEVGEGAEVNPEAILETLRLNAFTPIDETADELSTGWVDLFDYSIHSFEVAGRTYIGDYLAFSLRSDQRRIPAAVLKERTKTFEEVWLTQNPTWNRIPKKVREDLKETVKASLLAKTLPVPTVYDAVWDLKANIITFCNVGSKGIDLFQSRFKKCFPDYLLRFITPYDRALSVIGDDDDILTPLLLVANMATTESVLDNINSNSWLGTDFLLWLLYGSSEGLLTCADEAEGEGVSIYINDKLQLAGKDEAGIQKISFSGDQSKIAAVKIALREGKDIVAARIFMEKDSEQWAVTLRGDTFDFTGYKCPSVQIEKVDNDDELSERQAVFFERVHLVNKGAELFDTIFRCFLEDRITVEWNDKKSDIVEWLQS